jgi:GT2 family glycosyltransferase
LRVDISVIIPSYNSVDTIGDAIRSLLIQQTDRSYEIIVVDSSSDGTAEIVSSFPQVKLIHLDRRAYSGEARNLGVEAAEGSLIAFTDSDCIVEPCWLQQMWDAHQKYDCAAIGGAVQNGNPESLVSCASYITEFSQYMPTGEKRYRRDCVTCNISYKSWVFQEYGGFDTWLKRYVDYTFNSRLHQAGEKLLFDPSILVKHRHRVSLRRYAGHELSRGRSALLVRKMGLLPGSAIARCRLLCVVVSPLLLVRRIFADTGRVFRARGEVLRRFPLVLPYFLIGSASWVLGLALQGLLGTTAYPGYQNTAKHQSATEETMEVANG